MDERTKTTATVAVTAIVAGTAATAKSVAPDKAGDDIDNLLELILYPDGQRRQSIKNTPTSR